MTKYDQSSASQLDAANLDIGTVLSNGHFLVAIFKFSIVARDVKARHPVNWQVIHAASREIHAQHVALTRANLCVVDGPDVRVYNIAQFSLVSTLRGGARAFSCIACSFCDTDIVATGSIDGTIRVWDLKDISRVKLVTLVRPPLRSIAFSEAQDGLLAVIANETVHILVGDPVQRTIPVRLSRASDIEIFVWHPFVPHRALTTFKDGTVATWDFLAEAFNDRLALSTVDSDDDIFDLQPAFQQPLMPTWRLFFSLKARQVEWMGEYGILILSKSGFELCLYDARQAMSSANSIWEVQLSHVVLCVRFPDDNEGALLAITESGRAEKLIFPQHTLDAIGWSERVKSKAITASKHDLLNTHSESIPDAASEPAHSLDFHVKPIPIRALREAQRRLPARDTQALSNLCSENANVSHNEALAAVKTTPPATPHARDQTQSQELQTGRAADDSPMPFLSPSIPAQVSSPLGAGRSDEQFSLPRSLPDLIPPAPSTEVTEPDSDSDDETFAGEGIHGSGTLVPGAYRIPLPKSCGALFAPNGHLVTFFPPRVATPIAEGPVAEEENVQRDAKAKKHARLFPNFGNVLGEFTWTKEKDDSDSASSAEDDVASRLPSFLTDPESFPNQSTFRTRQRSIPASTKTPVKLVLSIRNVSDVIIERRKMAFGYRVFLSRNERGPAVCLHNAMVARAADLEDVAKIWQILAIVLDDRAPSAYPPNIFSGLSGARNATFPTPVISTLSVMAHCGCTDIGCWLVEQIIEWLERLADLQTLALLSAVLSKHVETSFMRPRSNDVGVRFLGNGHYSNIREGPLPQGAARHEHPTLRHYSVQSSVFEGSPTKHQRLSQTSSRNPSQPVTPYSETVPFTPPFTTPFSRQSSRREGSESASPEYNRGSFSVAARYYAQSITDKFASYGTSPTSKKLSVSPGNELSASLPTGSGSWSKTVSFASTGGTTKQSRSSFDLADGESDSDGDRTIDDTSLPHMPKAAASTPMVTYKNQDLLDSNVSGNPRASLLPDEAIVKGHLWRMQYADELRSWGLDLEAAEMEKVSGTIRDGITLMVHGDEQGPAVEATSRAAFCSVCACMIGKVEQVCAICLHAAHLACLEAYVQTEGAGSFTCPSGCGCYCASITEMDTLVSEAVDAA